MGVFLPGSHVDRLGQFPHIQELLEVEDRIVEIVDFLAENFGELDVQNIHPLDQLRDAEIARRLLLLPRRRERNADFLRTVVETDPFPGPNLMNMVEGLAVLFRLRRRLGTT